MALGGRPKEEGGHKPLKITVDKFVSEGLEKVGNKSQFIETLARPVLEKLDPGEASVFLWRIDAYIAQGIFKATKKRDFNQVNALGWLASSLDDARKLCGIPPSNFKLPEGRLTVQGKLIYDYFKDVDTIIKEDTRDSRKAMIKTRSLIMKLPSSMKEKIELDLDYLWKRFMNRYKENLPRNYDEKLRWNPPTGAPEVAVLIDKISTLLHESLKTGRL